jgi:hypothetical protein
LFPKALSFSAKPFPEVLSFPVNPLPEALPFRAKPSPNASPFSANLLLTAPALPAKPLAEVAGKFPPNLPVEL